MATIDTRAPCKEMGCAARADLGGYCDAHASSRTSSKERHKTYNKHFRNKEKLPVYASYRWKKLSKYVRSIHPLCTRCEAMKRYTVATLTDHLAGFQDENDFRAWDLEYLYPLCEDCHRVVTQLEKKIDFSDMPLEKAVFLKYQGAKIRKEKVIV